MFDNATRNVARFTERQIDVIVRCQGERARIGVLDRGSGLSPELLSHCVEAGVTTKEHGAGLGLTIVRTLAEQHGGALRLANRDGGGAVAELELPLRCRADPRIRRVA